MPFVKQRIAALNFLKEDLNLTLDPDQPKHEV